MFHRAPILNSLAEDAKYHEMLFFSFICTNGFVIKMSKQIFKRSKNVFTSVRIFFITHSYSSSCIVVGVRSMDQSIY